jgi:transposase InsO family protein
LWRGTCAELGITPKRTRPYRPQTNGRIERFHRTMADGWAFKKFYNSESARRAALPAWLHEYNHHRPHTAIGVSDYSRLKLKRARALSRPRDRRTGSRTIG